MMCLFHSNLKSILFQVYILYNTSPPEWMLTRKTSYCVIWYFGRCFSKQEIDMFVVIQCHLWLQYVNRTLTFPKSNINKCTTLHYVAHLLEEITSFLASIICYYKLLLMTSLRVDVAWGSPHNIHSYTAQYLHIGRHTVVTDTSKTLKTIRSQVPSNLTGNNTTDVLTVGLLHLLNLFVHQRTYNYILIFSWHYPLTNLSDIRFTPTSSSHRWCHFTQSKWWVIILLI